jgi:RNA-binding proteins (RRM domain)
MGTNKMFLGNLPWDTTTDILVDLLRDEGFTFKSAKVIVDRETGRSRGFSFVEFETPEAAAEAIAALDGYVHDGRSLRAAEATERVERGGGNGGRVNGGGFERMFGKNGGQDRGGHDRSDDRRGSPRRERSGSKRYDGNW